MNSPIIVAIIAIAALFIFLVIARRVFRLAIKLVFVGAIIIALLVGAAFGWWQGWFDGSSTSGTRSRPTQRAPSR